MMTNSEARKRNHVPKPTVGRIVHYRSRGSADRRFDPMCRAAIVTEAHPQQSRFNDAASLAVLSPTGMFFDQMVPRSVDMLPGTWHWYDECGEDA